MRGVERTCCPLCGGRIIVSDLYQLSHDYVITKKGVLSKRYTKGPEGSMECMIAACENAPDKCPAIWDSDSFDIGEDGHFYDYKYEGHQGASGA